MVPLKCHPERKRWTCELTADWSVPVPRLAGRGTYRFRAEKPGISCAEWLKLDDDGTVTIRKRYATDGCSCVPDFPTALPGCVLHDALRQACTLDAGRCPWRRGEADVIFREVMQAHGAGFLLRWIYYLGVAGPTGWLYSQWRRRFRPPRDRVC